MGNVVEHKASDHPTGRAGPVVTLPHSFGGTAHGVVAHGIIDCIHDTLSGIGISIGRGGIGSTIFIECSRKCYVHTTRNSVEHLLSDTTLEELRHPAKQDSCLEDIIIQGLVLSREQETNS